MVAFENEYRLPTRFDAPDVIVDIGAHIGSFSWACLTRGAGRVHAYEPEPANAALAAANLLGFGQRVCLHPEAVWRSDRPVDVLAYSYSATLANTGGGGVLSGGDFCVPVVSLDVVLAHTGRVRLLKLDCEGAEFPILLTSQRLDQISAICGEYHEIGGRYDHGLIPPMAAVAGVTSFTVDVLHAQLKRLGFRVRSRRTYDPRPGLFSRRAYLHQGLFWAWRD